MIVLENPDSYTIGWITALPASRAAATALLDDRHEPPTNFTQNPSDTNSYTWGRIGKHNVVIASLPAGVYGTTSAATTASNLLSSLPQIKIGLLVGIGSGIPHPEFDIRLGDVIVSQPKGTRGGVVQYDIGKANSDNWEPTGVLAKPPQVLLSALAALQAEYEMTPSKIPLILEEVLTAYPHMKTPRKRQEPGYIHQGFGCDRLFSAAYNHVGGSSCNGCDANQEIEREQRDAIDPEIHYGVIASGNVLVQNAAIRDTIVAAMGGECFCLETEAAGLMDHFPCLVIRGICDYADSHSNDRWHRYASATAAAFAKDILHYVPPKQLQDTPRAMDLLESINKDVKEIQAGITNLLGDVAALRSNHEKSEVNQCLRDLFITDPRLDKERIQDTGGSLLRESYYWIIQHRDYREFLDNPIDKLLWIKGDPGKGKTMLLCGIIDELQKVKDYTICYFFCQQTDSRLNNATSVLRGLIFFLVLEQPSLIRHIQTKYDESGGKIFEGVNNWVTMLNIFTEMITSPDLEDTIILVDALDECTTSRSELLDMIINSASRADSSIKWIISSRNWPEIEEKVNIEEQNVRLQLELNQDLVSGAIHSYINHKVNQLAKAKGYDNGTKSEIESYLNEHAGGTFLWVALVCQRLNKVKRWRAIDALKSSPPGLEAFYDRMMITMAESDDAIICKEILAIACLVYRPISIEELRSLVPMLENFDNDDITEIIGFCGSFLSHREEYIYFIHKSAKDFILAADGAAVVFSSGSSRCHYNIFSRSMRALMRTLKRDIYSLQHPGIFIDDIRIPQPDPLASIRYSSVYWIDHLEIIKSSPEIFSSDDLLDGGIIDCFMRTKYLYWLECLSLTGSIPYGLRTISRIRQIISESQAPGLTEVARDADRFLRYFKIAIETAPLQVYASGLVFAPTNSIIRRLFDKDRFDYISVKSALKATWGSCLQTLEGHSDWVMSTALSHSGNKLASASMDETVKIWDITTGACLQTLKSHEGWIKSMRFSQDDQYLTSVFRDGIIRIWDAITGVCLQVIEKYRDLIIVDLSENGKNLVSLSDTGVIKVWSILTGLCLQIFENYDGSPPNQIALSQDGKRLISGLSSGTIRVWDTTTGACLQTFHTNNDTVMLAISTPNGQKLASIDDMDRKIKIWNTTTGNLLQEVEGSTDVITSGALSRDGCILALIIQHRTIQIWDLATCTYIKNLEGHTGTIESVIFSQDSQQLISCSSDNTIKIWETTTSVSLPIPNAHTGPITSVAFSLDGQKLASNSRDKTIKIWNTTSGSCLHTLNGHDSWVRSIRFSQDGGKLISGSDDIKIWDTGTGMCLQTFEGHSAPAMSVIFSWDNKRTFSGSSDTTIKVWDVVTGACIKTLEGHSDCIKSVTLSHNGNYLASGSNDDTAKIWDITTGTCLQTFNGHSAHVESVIFSRDDLKIASGSRDDIIKIWDTMTGICLQTLEGHSYLVTSIIFAQKIAPDAENNPKLPTGDEDIDKSFIDSDICSVSSDLNWIVCKGHHVLWLPPDYRCLTYYSWRVVAVEKSLVAIGHPSGGVLIVEITL